MVSFSPGRPALATSSAMKPTHPSSPFSAVALAKARSASIIAALGSGLPGGSVATARGEQTRAAKIMCMVASGVVARHPRAAEAARQAAV